MWRPAGCMSGWAAALPWAADLRRPPGGGSSRQASLEMPWDESCSGGLLGKRGSGCKAMCRHGHAWFAGRGPDCCRHVPPCPPRPGGLPRDGGHEGAGQCQAVPANGMRRYKMTPLHGGISARHGQKAGRGMANAGMLLRVPWEPRSDTGCVAELAGDPLARQHDCPSGCGHSLPVASACCLGCNRCATEHAPVWQPPRHHMHPWRSAHELCGSRRTWRCNSALALQAWLHHFMTHHGSGNVSRHGMVAACRAWQRRGPACTRDSRKRYAGGQQGAASTELADTSQQCRPWAEGRVPHCHRRWKVPSAQGSRFVEGQTVRSAAAVAPRPLATCRRHPRARSRGAPVHSFPCPLPSPSVRTPSSSPGAHRLPRPAVQQQAGTMAAVRGPDCVSGTSMQRVAAPQAPRRPMAAPAPPSLLADGAGESQALPERSDRQAGHREAQVGDGVQRCGGAAPERSGRLPSCA